MSLYQGNWHYIGHEPLNSNRKAASLVVLQVTRWLIPAHFLVGFWA